MKHAVGSILALAIAACSGAGPVVPVAPGGPPMDPPAGASGGTTYGGATYGAMAGAPDAGAPPDSAPAAPASAAFDACGGPDECVVIFAGGGCVPSGPVAVAKAQIAAFQRTHAHPPPACGIGGRDYERQVMAIRARWGVTCNVGAQRCELVDRGENDLRGPH
ncbi:MAG: hypothetical protein K8W52_06925 [Deltaproteobacteria bacterium]|nr:hypothetical protein [Deltaproteobacteria bacterium]